MVFVVQFILYMLILYLILFNFLPVKFLQVQNKLYQLYYTESPLQE